MGIQDMSWNFATKKQICIHYKHQYLPDYPSTDERTCLILLDGWQTQELQFKPFSSKRKSVLGLVSQKCPLSWEPDSWIKAIQTRYKQWCTAGILPHVAPLQVANALASATSSLVFIGHVKLGKPAGTSSVGNILHRQNLNNSCMVCLQCCCLIRTQCTLLQQSTLVPLLLRLGKTLPPPPHRPTPHWVWGLI